MPDDLDDLVHDAASQRASEINNGGLGAQVEFLAESYGAGRARSLISNCGPDPLESVADLQGSMIDGYDDGKVNSVLGRISDASGIRLVCVWDVYDNCGVGGNSQFYVEEASGLQELIGDLWRWLNDDPDDPDAPAFPGTPASWAGENAGFTTGDLPYADGFHNYARRDQS